MRAASGSDPREIATFIGPGVIGIGLGVFVGLALGRSMVLAGVLGLVGAALGHAVGYLLLRQV